jgi:hypothetical protein
LENENKNKNNSFESKVAPTSASFDNIFNSKNNNSAKPLFLKKERKNESSLKRNFRFKLGDFGLSFNQKSQGLRGFGDSLYLAPELLKQSKSGEKIDFTKCDIFSLGLALVKFILDRVLVSETQKQTFLKMAKSGNFTFLEESVFQGVDVTTKQILKKMMKIDPKNRICSMDILKMLKVRIPMITPKEIQSVHKELPLATFNLKSPNKVRHPSFLSKRSDCAIETPEKAFCFPVLESSKPAQSGSQACFEFAAQAPKTFKKSLFSLDTKHSMGDFLLSKKSQRTNSFKYSKENMLKQSKSFLKGKLSASKVLSDLDLPWKTQAKSSGINLNFELDLNLGACVTPFA